MSPAAALPVLAATGMLAEAGIARGPGVVAIAGGGDPARLALMLQAALDRQAKGIISFGIAGGLKGGHAPGSIVLANAVHADGQRIATDATWMARLAARLPRALPGDIVGVDQAVTSPAGKAALHRATGAVAVDMESHIAARLAAVYGVPFAALRIIADPSHRALPEAAMLGMRPDGSMDAGAVLRALVRRPGDIPALLRTAMDASVAFAALRACRRHLPGMLGVEEVSMVGATAPMCDDDAAMFGTPGEIQVENG